MTFEEALAYGIGDIARGYTTLKAEIAKQDAAYAERMKPHREQLEIYLKAMGRKLGDLGVNSARTDHGTVYTTTIETVKLENWDDFHAFVEEMQESDFLVRSANKTAVLEYRDKYRKLPPGISTSSIVNINFRKS